jgi:TM2 domain-containing membrane protein YozV
MNSDTHSKSIGYVLWVFGFTGAHRFYYGKRWTGLLWLCTGGLFGIGWFIDLFLIPGMDAEADSRYMSGRYDYTFAWLLQTFGGVLGLHHFYLGNVVTGLVWLVTGGLCGIGWAYDFWRLNELVDSANRQA